MERPSTGTKVAARSRSSSIPLSTSPSSILRSSTSTSRSLYCPNSNSGRTSNVARNFTGPVSVKSTLSTFGCVTGTSLPSVTARSICSGTRDCSTSLLMSSAKRRRISVTGAFPGRNPGTRATRANSLATRSSAFCTVSAGISSSSSRRQVASVIVTPSESQIVFSDDRNESGAIQGSYFYSLPLLGPENWKRERTASGIQRKQSIGESSMHVNSHQVCPEDKISNDLATKTELWCGRRDSNPYGLSATSS